MNHSKITYREEQRLWQNFRKGNKQALIKIYKHYYPYLLDYGLSIKNNEAFVVDSILELFSDLLTNRSAIDTENSVLFYLFDSLEIKIFRRLNYDMFFGINDNSFFIWGMPMSQTLN
jgi:hypothetical protein